MRMAMAMRMPMAVAMTIIVAMIVRVARAMHMVLAQHKGNDDVEAHASQRDVEHHCSTRRGIALQHVLYCLCNCCDDMVQAAARVLHVVHDGLTAMHLSN